MSDSDFQLNKAPSAYTLRKVTEAAAYAAYEWIGRGERGHGDNAAINAMYDRLDGLGVSATVIVGDGDPEDDKGLLPGTKIGPVDAEPDFDLALDPIEGTTYLARGMTNALAAVAMAPAGTLFEPGPSRYMEKLVVPPSARGLVSPEMPVKDRLEALAKALDKPVSDLTVFVLEKPRHRELVKQIYNAGARVALYPAGDIAGAIMASIPGSNIDALMGTGGTREVMVAACAVRALGGDLYGRIDPQLTTEKAAVSEVGMDTREWRGIETLVTSDDVMFSATGITTGLLFDGVAEKAGEIVTQSLLIAGPDGQRQILTSYHNKSSFEAS
ncbi:MAG: fructose-bisphosphatase class II [Rhodospirillaceae bacterium]|jgi:fructose-1,6-bisphosphatase II|nr:fructose-bisphosphatase class II [Rhodospirillaceae bacterium]MBT5309353.1 fructose-bisphosphatase class II [Rhodospirillaceae bacterium]MBT6406774.1 fructose-bisphosphatase class II [Rhodospirillaceae bacterium]MBT7356427.1 fructose-bisphosphatase class II [Rhodospirillaceae bacterium]